jgi:hypothetical protein
VNVFSDPEAASKAFRPALLSEDIRVSGYFLRGRNRWGVDMNLARTILSKNARG